MACICKKDDKGNIIGYDAQCEEHGQIVKKIIIDLVRLPIYGSLLQADYRGICW